MTSCSFYREQVSIIWSLAEPYHMWMTQGFAATQSYPQTRCQRNRLSQFLRYVVFHICLDEDECFLTAANTRPISRPPAFPAPYPQLQNEHFPAHKQ